jgi:hypothetical protein
MPNKRGEEPHMLALIEVDAGRALQSRSCCFWNRPGGMPDESEPGPTPGQDAVAVSLAAKHKTDGYGFWAAVRTRNLLILYKQLVVSQAPSKARCSSRANPSKIQAK